MNQSLITLDHFSKPISICDEGIEDWTSMLKIAMVCPREDIRKKNAEFIGNTIRIYQIEKQIYVALTKSKNSLLFSLMIKKIDQLFNENYELLQELVQMGERPEADYLLFCEASLETRTYLKDMCEAGRNQYQCKADEIRFLNL